MAKYEDEMYKFVTNTENFESVCDLVDQFQIVKQRLREDFWREVKDTLQQELERFNGWNILMSEELNSKAYLLLYREDFCFEKGYEAKVGIRIEHLLDVPWFGLFVRRDWASFNFPEIWAKAKELKSPNFKLGNINGYWWPLYNILPYNFSQTKDIKFLIPDRREVMVKEVVLVIMNAMDELAAFMESYFIQK